MVRNSFARQLVGLDVCAQISGLGAHEMLLGVSPCERHDRLFARYRMKAGDAQDALPARIVTDIRRALDLGALARAADLLVVLREFLAASGPDGGNRLTPCVRRVRGREASRRGVLSGADACREAPARASMAACDVVPLDAFRTARAARAGAGLNLPERCVLSATVNKCLTLGACDLCRAPSRSGGCRE